MCQRLKSVTLSTKNANNAESNVLLHNTFSSPMTDYTKLEFHTRVIKFVKSWEIHESHIVWFRSRQKVLLHIQLTRNRYHLDNFMNKFRAVCTMGVHERLCAGTKIEYQICSTSSNRLCEIDESYASRQLRRRSGGCTICDLWASLHLLTPSSIHRIYLWEASWILISGLEWDGGSTSWIYRRRK